MSLPILTRNATLLVALALMIATAGESPYAIAGQDVEQQPKPFLDQKKQIPAGKEWDREVTSQNGGSITFRVTSPGPFSVTVITDSGLNALKNNQKIKKEDVLLTIDDKGPTLERSLKIPPGSIWFIIENKLDKDADIRLECFAK